MHSDILEGIRLAFVFYVSGMRSSMRPMSLICLEASAPVFYGNYDFSNGGYRAHGELRTPREAASNRASSMNQHPPMSRDRYLL